MENQSNNQNGKQPVNAAKWSIKLKHKIERCIIDLQRGLYERDEVVRLCLLALLAGEHVFMLGSPGVAKSMLAERLTNVLKDGKLFAHLMTRYTQPEELFGPFSISKLTKDIFERETKNKLPQAEMVFLDEIWKSNSNILNTLLTALNERKFYNGSQNPEIPLHSLICASNEGPPSDKSADALYDRVMIRILVEGIKEKENMKKFLMEEGGAKPWKIRGENQFSLQEIKEIGDFAKLVELPDEIAELMVMLQEELSAGDKDQAPLKIETRRMKKVDKLLRVSAWVSGRGKVNLNDCALIPHCLWEKPEQKNWIQQKMAWLIKDKLFQSISRVEELGKKSDELKSLMKGKDKSLLMVGMIEDKFKELCGEIKKEVKVSWEKEIEKKEECTESILFTGDISDLAVRDLRKTRTELESIHDTLEAAYHEFINKIEGNQNNKAA